MRDWSVGGGRRWWRQELQVDWVMRLNYFKDNEETVSGVCRILSTGEPSLPFPRSPQDRRCGGITPGKFLNNCRAAAVGKNATRRRVSRISLASVVNTSRCRRRGLSQGNVATHLRCDWICGDLWWFAVTHFQAGLHYADLRWYAVDLRWFAVFRQTRGLWLLFPYTC